MAKRHLMQYYQSICNQVTQSQQLLEEFAKCSSESMVNPKVVESVKKTYESILNNKKRLDYVLYLLDMPNKSNKENKFNNMNKKKLQQMEIQGEIKENDVHLSSIQNSIDKSRAKK